MRLLHVFVLIMAGALGACASNRTTNVNTEPDARYSVEGTAAFVNRLTNPNLLGLQFCDVDITDATLSGEGTESSRTHEGAGGQRGYGRRVRSGGEYQACPAQKPPATGGAQQPAATTGGASLYDGATPAS